MREIKVYKIYNPDLDLFANSPNPRTGWSKMGRSFSRINHITSSISQITYRGEFPYNWQLVCLSSLTGVTVTPFKDIL